MSRRKLYPVKVARRRCPCGVTPRRYYGPNYVCGRCYRAQRPPATPLTLF